jgi:hypothetical protein
MKTVVVDEAQGLLCKETLPSTSLAQDEKSVLTS